MCRMKLQFYTGIDKPGYEPFRQPEVLTSFLIYLTMLDKWLGLIHLANLSSWCLRPF